MKLDWMELRNFRQFEDDSLEFARDEDNGVTVVHGPNGAGKTTLLNAFTWLFYEEVSFETRPDRLVTEGTIANASPGEQIAVSVELGFDHDGRTYRAKREAIFEKQSGTDFDGKLVDMDLTVRLKKRGTWNERGNPSNTLDQILPERLSDLFFFDGEDIEELAGIENQERIQESIQNIMGLTILERATRHLDDVSGRFEDEVEEHASDELAELIESKRETEEIIDELDGEMTDTECSIKKIEQEIRDIEQKLERLDESAALQERREEYQEERKKTKDQISATNQDIKRQIDNSGFVAVAMPLIRDTAEELNAMRKDGVIPSDLTNSYIDSLLEAEQCICGQPLEPGTDHYEQVRAMKGEAIAEGVEESAIKIIGHLNQMTDMEASFFETVDELIEKRKRLQDEVESLTEKIDEVSAELQEMDQTTKSGESIPELEAQRESKEKTRKELLNEKGKIEERINQNKQEIEELEEEIDRKRDEREEALLAKRRQKAAESVGEKLSMAFAELKDKVRRRSNKKINETFDSIATKNLTAEITEDFELRIWQDVRGEQIEVDKSTGERQIASLAFVGSLVAIARERYEKDSDSQYFTGGIYPLVMDSPFGALDKSHRRQVSRVVPEMANQIVVFATDSQWEGPVEDEMGSSVGEQYWLDFEDGSGENEYPRTRIASEQASARSD